MRGERVAHRAVFAGLVARAVVVVRHGIALCDFPGGDARTLFASINKVLSLPGRTRLYMCHDYQPGAREVRYETTVEEERTRNIHVRDGISAEEFVAMRNACDATLPMPVLILPAVQVNMRAGGLPEPEDNGVRYLKIPLNAI
jgi:glyoxylase-like metal-dependent hydrolase (beta-lactamase superfamily II)